MNHARAPGESDQSFAIHIKNHAVTTAHRRVSGFPTFHSVQLDEPLGLFLCVQLSVFFEASVNGSQHSKFAVFHFFRQTRFLRKSGQGCELVIKSYVLAVPFPPLTA